MMKKTLKKALLVPMTCSMIFVLTACNDDEPVETPTETPSSLDIENPNVVSGIGGGTSGSGGGGGPTNNASVKRGESLELQTTVFAGVSESATYESMKSLASQDIEVFNKLKYDGKIFELKRGTMVTVVALYGDIAEIQVADSRKNYFVPTLALAKPNETNTQGKEEQKN